MRTSLFGLLVAASVMVGCGDKGGAKPTGSGAATTSAAAPASAAKSGTATGTASTGCAPGEALDKGKCVTVVPKEEVVHLGDEVKQLGDYEAMFDKLEKVKAVLTLVDLFMKSDAWKTAEKAKPELADAAKVVATLKDATKKLDALRGSVKSSRDLVKGVVDSLAGTAEGKKAVAELAKVKADVNGRLDELAKQVDAMGKDVAERYVEPALAELEKLEEWIDAVCAVVDLTGGDELKKACRDATNAGQDAKDFLTKAKTLPADVIRSLRQALEKSLGDMVKGTALEKAFAEADKAGTAPAGSGAPATSASAAPSASAGH